MPQFEVNASIASWVNVRKISCREVFEMGFRTTEQTPWPPDMKVSIWNSSKKNAVIVDDKPLLYTEPFLMKWPIDPQGDSIEAGLYYFEIFAPESKRIIIQGNIEFLP